MERCVRRVVWSGVCEEGGVECVCEEGGVVCVCEEGGVERWV